MAQTIFVNLVKVYTDYRTGTGDLNLLLDFFINSMTTKGLERVIVNGDDYVQAVQNETTTALMRDIMIDHIANAGDGFANGWRMYCELTSAEKATPVPVTWPYWETAKASGIARTLGDYFMNWDSINPVGNTMFLVQITDYDGNLIPIYKYNIDGTENAPLAQSEWASYVLIYTALNPNKCYSYKQGQSILNSDEYNADSVAVADRSVPPADSVLKALREQITSIESLSSFPLIEDMYKQMWVDFINSLPDKGVASVGELCTTQVSPSNKVKVMGVKTS